MILRRLLFLCLLAPLLTACYEERLGCLDPDATNFDVRADEACEDGCCTYPSLFVSVRHRWDTVAFNRENVYVDGAGNDFRLVRFRYYLSGLELISPDVELPLPALPVELPTVQGGDTTTVTLNRNLALYTVAAGTTRTAVGSLRLGTAALSGLRLQLGLPPAFDAVLPSLVASGDPLRTQPGLLNFRDGRGYVTARAEYSLLGSGDTVSVSTYTDLPLAVDFGGSVRPPRGFDLTLAFDASLSAVFGTIDLAADSATVAARLDDRLPEMLRLTEIR